MHFTRRAALASVAAGCIGIASCSTYVRSSSSDDPPPSGVDEPPDPDKHIFGVNGSWSGFGCNASNTRSVADGKASTGLATGDTPHQRTGAIQSSSAATDCGRSIRRREIVRPAVQQFGSSTSSPVGLGRPILDDGTLYVVAQVDAEAYALLALE